MKAAMNICSANGFISIVHSFVAQLKTYAQSLLFAIVIRK